MAVQQYPGENVETRVQSCGVAVAKLCGRSESLVPETKEATNLPSPRGPVGGAYAKCSIVLP